MLDITVFFSYSHKDEQYRDELAAHLKLFERIGEIKSWHDRLIDPGSRWKKEIDSRIFNADIILALVSSDFMASDYCYGEELDRALSQHKTGRSILIPIIIRPVSWSKSPLGELQALPRDGKPVTRWDDRDAAWKNVADGILRVVGNIRKKKKAFLERFPSVLREYVEKRTVLGASDDSAVARNIARVTKKHPKIGKQISNFQKQFRDYAQKVLEAIPETYDLVYGSGMPIEMSVMLVAGKWSELCDMQSKCLLEETKIREQLEKKKLKAFHFGFPGSTLDCWGELTNTGLLTADLLSSFVGVAGALNKSVLGPLREIGEKEQGEDFEEL